MEITKEIAMKVIESKFKLNKEGLFKNVKVTGIYEYQEEDEKSHENMVGYIYLNAFNAKDVTKIISLMKEGEFEEATKVSASFTIWKDKYFPRKGERVDIQVEEKTWVTEDGEEKTMFVVVDILPQRENEKSFGLKVKENVEETKEIEEKPKKKASIK